MTEPFNYKIAACVVFLMSHAVEAISVLNTESAPNIINPDGVLAWRTTPPAPAHEFLGVNDAGGHALRK